MSNIFQMTRQSTLADLGEGLAAKFCELSKRPCADRCDYLLRDLTEATNAVRRLRTTLEQGGDAA